MPKDKLIPTGIPVFKKFANRLQKPEARNHLIIPQKQHIYMIMTGGIGCGDVMKLCGEILKDSDLDIAVYVLSGRNDQLKEDVDQRHRQDPRVQSVVFTDKVNIYMNAADVLLSKPGGISSTEAAVANVPLVHTMAIPGCETKNADFFAHLGMSLNAKTAEEAIRFANLLIRDNERAEQMRVRQRAEINSDAAKDIAAYVREHTGTQRTVG